MKPLQAKSLLVLALAGFLASACSQESVQLEEAVEHHDSMCWRCIDTATVPPARFDHAMAVDHPGGRIYLWGGRGRRGFLGDLWVYHPGNAEWREIQTEQPPSPRSGHSLVFDSQSGRLVLFGGVSFKFSGELQLHRDLWLFSGESGWSREFFSTGPSGRAWHAALATRGTMVIFGGFEGPPGYYLQDIWSCNLQQLTFARIATDGGPLMAGTPALLDKGGPSSLLAFGPSELLIFGREGMPKPARTGVWSLRVELDLWAFQETRRAPDDDFTFAVADSRKETMLVARGPAEEDEDREWTIWIISGVAGDWREYAVHAGPATAQGMKCAARPDRNDEWICFGGANRGRVSGETWLLAPCAEEE